MWVRCAQTSIFGSIEPRGSRHALCWRASASSPGAQPTHYPLPHAVHSRHRSGPPLRLARRLAKPLLVSWGVGFALRAYWFGLHAPSSRRGKVVFAPPHAHPRLHSLLMDSLEPVDTESRSYLARNTEGWLAYSRINPYERRATVDLFMQYIA